MPEPWIVVVDDDEPQRYATRRVLQAAGYRVEEAGTGQAALELASKLPSLVILDVNLPDINGFEVCRRIKADPLTKYVTVLHLSAHKVSTAAKVTGLQVGADAYLTQPVEPEELVATVATLLRAQQAEEALRESEETYRLLFESNPLPCAVFANDTQRILAVNNAAVEHYGYSKQELLAKTIFDLRPEGGPRAVLHEMVGRPERVSFRSVIRKKDGVCVDVDVSWQPMRFRGQPATLAVAVDLTEREAAAEARRDAIARQHLLTHVMAAQEEERRRIARELHDETGQLLTSLLLRLRAVEEAKKLAMAKTQAQEARQITARAIDEVGRLARGLHPTVLDDLGLREALLRLISAWETAHGDSPEVTLDISDADISNLPFVQQIGVYRIVQEALTNAHKHAGAKHVTVRIARDGRGVELAVSDDGVGFDPDEARLGIGLGVQGMRERARSLGGELRIDSGSSGTRVLATIPWQEEDAVGATNQNQ